MERYPTSSCWGAERVVLEYARRLVQDGHTVSWLGSGFQNALPYEEIEGIHVYRKYHIYTIYFLAWIWYRRFTRENPVDIIIDEAGGVPQLSPLYVKNVPIFFLIHHIGEKESHDEFGGPIGWIGKKVIFFLFSLYKNFPTITVSDSTKKELEARFHFTNVSVVENATQISPIEAIDWNAKKKEIVFYGRLTRIKRVDHAIRVFSIFHTQFLEYSMNIIGNPQDMAYVTELQELVQTLGLQENVHFLGYCPDLAPYLTRAEALLVTSMKEGYGLVVLEGNAYGLPAFAYDVEGLRDSIRDGKNGILAPEGDVDALGEKLIEYVGNPEKLMHLSESSLTFIKDFGGWDTRYQEFKNIIFKK